MRAAAGPVIPNFAGAQLELRGRTTSFSAGDWVEPQLGTVLWPALRQHVVLTLIAVAIGFAISMALALVAAPLPAGLERPTLLVTTFLYTIPSLALFELLVAPVGANIYAAEIALVSYTLLILFRNILTGLRDGAAPRCSTRPRGWA